MPFLPMNHRVTVVHEQPDGTRDVYTTREVGTFDLRTHRHEDIYYDDGDPGLYSTEFVISGGMWTHTRIEKEIMEKLVRELKPGDETATFGKVKYTSPLTWVHGVSVVAVCFEDHEQPKVFSTADVLKVVAPTTLQDALSYSRKLEVEKAASGEENVLYLRITEDYDRINPHGIYVDRDALRRAIER